MNPTNGYPAGMTTETFAPDKLIVGGPIRSKKVTLLSGENRTRGALLGAVLVGTPTAAAFAGNTSGSGSVGSLTIGTAKKAGVYKVVMVEPGSNAGTFIVEDPDGIVLGTGTVAVAFTATGAPSFTISDATDFAAGDGFNITVAAGSGKYKLSASAATDGSQTPDVILSEDCDASAGDKECMVYYTGDFDSTALTLGTGHTVASVSEGLRLKGIHLITPAVSA